MNSLFGIIDINKPNTHKVIQHELFRNNILTLEITRNHVFKYDSENYFFNPIDNCMIAIIGYFTNLYNISSQLKIDEIKDVKIVYSIYKQNNITCLDKLDGVFLIIYFDFTNLKCQVFQSSFGMNLPLYYFKECDKLYFSTSLKRLLPYKSSRTFNKKAARDFIFYEEIIPNETTLIEGIYKLIPNQMLEFNLGNGSWNIKRYINKRSLYTKDRAKEILINTLEDIISTISKDLIDNIALTHTGGWDSNFMLHILRKYNIKSNISTVTIKGGEKIDEVATAKEIQTNFYNNLTSYTSIVSTELVHFPDLVWTYEGYVFEGGMFLRYELSKLLNRNGIRSIFLGATADQVLYPPKKLKRFTRNLRENIFISFIKHVNRIFSGEKQMLNGISRKSLRRTSKNKNFSDIQIDMLLKMHEIALNSFEITGLYPYLNKKTAEASKALGKLNKGKKYYKQQISTILDKEIISYLAKSHTIVDTMNIFKVNKVFLIQKFIDYKDFITGFLDIDIYNRLLKNPDDNHLLIIQCIYIAVFNKLFLSQQYDHTFNTSHLSLTFQDLG